MNSRRTLPFALLAILSVALHPAVSLAAEPDSTFEEKIEVNLVDLNVVVTSYWGRPVTDLTRDDFEIYEDGEPRQISHFSRVVDGVPEGAAETGQASLDGFEGASGEAQPSTALDRSIVLAFDAGIQRPYLRRALRAARDFVTERAGDGIWWSVVLLASEPHSFLPLTNDDGQVVAALESLLAQNHAGSRFEVPAAAVPRSPHLEGPWCRLALTERSLTFSHRARGLSEIFRAYASVPGAKACVIYQQGRGGTVVNRVDERLLVRQHVELWRDLGRQATSAGFRVYAMDVLGLNPPRGVGSPASNTSLAAFHSFPSISTADVGPSALANLTGGDSFALNHLDEAVKAAAREIGTYYTVAFVAPHGHDGEPHDLEVRVPGRPWLEVRHSAGFLDVDPRTLLVEHLAAPAYFPKQGGALSLTLELTDPSSGADKLDVTGTVATRAGDLTLVPEGAARVAHVDFFVAVHDRTGALVSLRQDRRRVRVGAEGDFRIAVPVRLRLPESAYSVTVALYDPVSGLSGIASEQIGGRDSRGG
ncbi:MAG: VWA domain-containing protein [bacterium]|nr:VWA domain-containing protein [bacterium]